MGRLIALGVILDTIWATLLATFGATMIYAFLGFSDAATASDIASVLGWLIIFIIALVQGGVFLVVGFFIVISLLALLKR